MLADRVQMGAGKRGIYLAKDSDFSGETNGTFRYIGTKTKLEIPHVIKGIPVTSYSSLFDSDQGKLITKVVSTNSNVTTMASMFYGSQATTLDLSSFDTSNVINMASMFYGSQATTLDLSSFDTSNVTTMVYMFRSSQATTLDLSSFDTSNVTNMAQMFRRSQATTLDLSSFDTSSVTKMDSMFDLSSATTGYARTQIDADKFNTSSNKPEGLNFVVYAPYATDDDFSGTADGSFKYIGNATTVKIPPVIKGVPVTSYASMFNTDNGKLVEKVISFNPNVTGMNGMFYCSKATTLDLSSFDTSNVTSMSGMFMDSQATTLDLSSFDTSNVTFMSGMFMDSQATTGYARTQADADRFNTSSDKPEGLNFVVK